MRKKSPLRRLTTGRAMVNPKKPGKMNGLEARYAEYLDERGADFLYERVALILTHGGDGRKGMRYTPDFMVNTFSGVEFHEVKGVRRSTGMNKLKLAEQMFRGIFRFYLVELSGGKWLVREV